MHTRVLLAIWFVSACGSDGSTEGSGPIDAIDTASDADIEPVDSAASSATGADTGSHSTGETAATGATGSTGGTGDSGDTGEQPMDRYASYVDCVSVLTDGILTIQAQYDSRGLLEQYRVDLYGSTVVDYTWVINKATGYPERTTSVQTPGGNRHYIDFDAHGWTVEEGDLDPSEVTATQVNTYDAGGLLLESVHTETSTGQVTTSSYNSCEHIVQQSTAESGRVVLSDTLWTYDAGCLPVESVTTNDTTAEVVTVLFDSEGRYTSVTRVGGANDGTQTTVWTCP